ncbi:hypothetical protein JW906_13825 [bacterium]|nr:hypothetical protein [bacterium]
MPLKRLIIGLLVCILIPVESFGKSWTFITGGSYAQKFGAQSQYWNAGFSAGISGFHRFSDIWSAGLRLGYCRWTPDGYRMMDLAPPIRMKAIYTVRVDGVDSLDYDNLYLFDSKSGGTTVLEFVPSVRFKALKDAGETLALSGQVGAGLFMIRSDARAVGRYGPNVAEVRLDEVSEVKPGIQLGISLVVRKQLEFMPLWTFVFTESNRRSYFLMNLGFLFEL